jgi:hypothetical protein
MKNIFLLLAVILINVACSSPEKELIKAKEKNTIEAYQEFIDKNPNSSLIHEAKELILTVEFENAKKQNTDSAFFYLIEKYPGTIIFDSSLVLLNNLLLNEALNTNSINALNDYLVFAKNYKVLNSIDQISHILDSVIFDNVMNIGTKYAMNQFIKDYPDSRFEGIARNLTYDYVIVGKIVSRESYSKFVSKNTSLQLVELSADNRYKSAARNGYWSIVSNLPKTAFPQASEFRFYLNGADLKKEYFITLVDHLIPGFEYNVIGSLNDRNICLIKFPKVSEKTVVIDLGNVFIARF